MKKVQRGSIDTSALSAPPEPHEHRVAKYFSKYGFNIIFIKPSNIKGLKSPDFEMGGRIWEIKSPITYSDTSFEDNYRKAMKQSKHIIFDLRSLNSINETKYIKELTKWKDIGGVKTLMIISRNGKLFTIKGKFDIM